MYDKKLKTWVSDCTTEELKLQCKNPDYANDEYTMFLKASELLAEMKAEKNVAQAVSEMHALAKKEYPPAIFAMGQMCFYGWGVHKDKKRAIEWYKQAAELDYKPAQKLLADIKKTKTIKILSVVFSIILIAVIGILVFIMLFSAGKQIIKVNEKTQLSKTVTAKEFSSELGELITQYDDELVVSGKVSSNRIVLKFEGNRLDLSDFFADRVIARENNIVVIQFSDETEAKRCLEELKKEKKILFVEMDEYNISLESISEEYCKLEPVKTTDYTADYYSWGVPDLGLDKLSDYVSENFSENEVLVVVIDSGAYVHSENAHRFIGGYNIVYDQSPIIAEHGTHVSGIILDGANCDNIFLYNIDVFDEYDNSSSILFSAAIDTAVEMGADVINMSLRGEEREILKESIRNAYQEDVVIVKSAGNLTADIATGCSFPADMDELIVVGAYDIDHNIASFSNYGDSVDVCAPGVSVWNYGPGGDGSLIRLDGTSMAAPHITAMAALLKAIYPNATVKNIEDFIRNSCRTFTNPDAFQSGKYGAGAPDASIFIEP